MDDVPDGRGVLTPGRRARDAWRGQEPPRSAQQPGRGDLGRGDIGRSDLGRGDIGRGDIGRGNIGRGDIGRGDIGRGNIGRGDIGRSMLRPYGVAEAALLSLIAHELRTPLTVASGTLSMLESGRFGVLPPTHQHAVEMAVRSVARIHTMADDLSAAARIARGEWPLLTAPVAMTDIIADVAHTLHAAHPTLAVNVPPGASPTTAVVDRGTVVRAVVALAHLALRDATAEAVSLRVLERERDSWLVVSAPGPHDAATPAGATPIDPATNGQGFSLYVAAALLELHGLQALRLPAPPEVAAFGIAFPR